jgi:hypothetical protein
MLRIRCIGSCLSSVHPTDLRLSGPARDAKSLAHLAQAATQRAVWAAASAAGLLLNANG